MKIKARNPGVYTITCFSTGKIYVGGSVDVDARMQSHRKSLRRGEHHNRHLQASWCKYGEGSFEFEQRVWCEEASVLFEEQKLMDALKPEFNLAPLAGSCRGVKWSDEAVAKIRGRRLPDHVRAAMLGNKRSVGAKRSPEQRANASAVHKGKIVSESTREKIRLANTGRPVAPQTKEKMRARMKGNAFAKGLRWSEERKAAHAARVKGWWAKKKEVACAPEE